MHRTTFSPKCCWPKRQFPCFKTILRIFCSYRNFQDQLVTTIVGFECIENRRQCIEIVEFHCKDEISYDTRDSKLPRRFQKLALSFNTTAQESSYRQRQLQ